MNVRSSAASSSVLACEVAAPASSVTIVAHDSTRRNFAGVTPHLPAHGGPGEDDHRGMIHQGAGLTGHQSYLPPTLTQEPWASVHTGDEYPESAGLR